MIEHVKFAKEMQVKNTVLVENGDIVKIAPGGKPAVYDKAPHGRLYVDGSVSIEEDGQSIKDRRNISNNGFMDVTIIISSNGNIIKDPLLTIRGLPIYDSEEFKFGLQEKIFEASKTFSLTNKKQESNLIDAIKVTCRKYSREKTGKKPLTNINLVRVW